LNAGKHVYCEKPLGMTFEEAREVIELAERLNLTVCGAPANGLSDAQQLVASLIAGGRIGQPRLAYAEMEDGPVFKDNWTEWRSLSGAKWPGLHEFEVGCTLEHAGYGLSWLVSLFGAGRGRPGLLRADLSRTRGRAPRASRWPRTFRLAA
jgi:predicted dehydrogenase